MQKAFAINYFGLFFAAKYKIAAMLKNGGGSVVNISSGCGLRGEYSVAAYTATKHAICGFSKCAALDYAQENIRVNCVCPGVTNTPMFAMNKERDPAACQHLVEQNPMKRMMDPREIAHPAVWLCSEGASSVSGVEFVVDGAHTPDKQPAGGVLETPPALLPLLSKRQFLVKQRHLPSVSHFLLFICFPGVPFQHR